MPSDQAREPTDARAQLLATEHWGLLASRSTTQSEVLSRISMFLTVVSAGLVSLALIGQATAFGDPFAAFAIAILAFVCVVGLLTQARVFNASMDDLMYVVAMNRLRAAYVELEPSIAPYFLASPHDDRAGADRTYYFLGVRSPASQVSASSGVFIMAINGAIIGLLAAAIAAAGGAALGWFIAIGVVAGAAFCGLSIAAGQRVFMNFWRGYSPLNPTPTDPNSTGSAVSDPSA